MDGTGLLEEEPLLALESHNSRKPEPPLSFTLCVTSGPAVRLGNPFRGTFIVGGAGSGKSKLIGEVRQRYAATLIPRYTDTVQRCIVDTPQR